MIQLSPEKEVIVRMPIFMKGSYFFVRPGQKCFEISSNFSNYLEIGNRGVTEYYLEAKIDNDEFKISGTLLDEKGEILCTLDENFIEKSQGCTKEMTRNGYRIKDNDGNQIFEIRVEDNICRLQGTIYSKSGDIVAKAQEGNLVILKGPAIIGKANGSIGIRLN